ncbi:MAG: hypothetical protein WAT92_15255, partial [Saprospiraceae bacterium]
MSRYKAFLLCCILSLFSLNVVCQLELLKDIYPGPTSGTVAPGGAIYNSKFYFGANDKVHSTEIHVSEGTNQTTKLFVNLANNAPFNLGGNPDFFYASSNKLYFRSSDSYYRQAPYVTDGTVEGTIRLMENGMSWFSHTEIDGIVYFTLNIHDGAGKGKHGFELWRSDGTRNGTYMVKDIIPGPTSSFPVNFINYNDTIYFNTRESTGSNLWITDGTESGTLLKHDFNPNDSLGNYYIESILVHNDKLLIHAQTAEYGGEWWTYDSSSGNYSLLKDINRGVGPGTVNNVTFNGDLYLFGRDVNNHHIMWRTDGTTQNTVEVYN